MSDERKELLGRAAWADQVREGDWFRLEGELDWYQAGEVRPYQTMEWGGGTTTMWATIGTSEAGEERHFHLAAMRALFIRETPN